MFSSTLPSTNMLTGKGFTFRSADGDTHSIEISLMPGGRTIHCQLFARPADAAPSARPPLQLTCTYRSAALLTADQWRDTYSPLHEASVPLIKLLHTEAPVNNLKTDAAGRAFITHEEGDRLHEYKCAAGVDTIGVGHTQGVTKGMTITEAQSQQFLSEDLAHFEAAVNRLVTVPINQHQFNALVSFSFNLGEKALERSSLLRLINEKVDNPAVLKSHFAMWDEVKGRPNKAILARRVREANLFLTHG